MIDIDIKCREDIPLTDEQLKVILHQVAYKIDVSELKTDEAFEKTHIFDPKNTKDFEGGFEMVFHFFKDSNDSVGAKPIKMIIFENDDEWLDAYKRIKGLNESKEHRD